MVPGSIVSIFGSAFSTATGVATTVPLPTTLGGTQVMMNGVAAPLYAVTPSQINALVPWEARGLSDIVNVQVVTNGTASAMAPTGIGRPGIFTTLQSGRGPGVITHADGSLVTLENPSVRSEVVIVYCTGLGDVRNRPPSGSAASSTVLSETTIKATATVGNIQSTVLFSGLAPGFVGLYQVNLQVPPNLPPIPFNNPDGPVAQVVVSISAAQSNIVNMAVR